MEALRDDKRYTYEDYYSWDDGKRYELIDGVVRLMSPAPRARHQDISGEIYLQLRLFLKGKRCKVYHAPFDVRLNADGADDTVVQPDITVVCDRSKIDKRGLRGVPDMIVEVLSPGCMGEQRVSATSPSTAKHDAITKFNKYLEAGVLEYWIVDPERNTVKVCLRKDGDYVIKTYDETDDAPVSVLPGCVIRLAEVFEDDETYIFDDERSGD